MAPGLTLLPGQLLRFEGAAPVYGQVQELRALPHGVGGLQEGQIVQIALLRGSPSLEPIHITPLTPRQMVDEMVQLLPVPEHPLDLGTFQADYLRLGALTLVTGDDFLSKYQVLLTLMDAVKPYQKILVLDPIGIFESVGDVACYTAGDTVRLGLQEVSAKRFLETFGGLFPAGVRKPVTETVASHWPESGAFSGFSPLLVSGMITESLLKNLILQNCAHVIRNKVFAEAPEQVLDLKKMAKHPVSVIDLSALQAPWKRFVYQEVMEQVFSRPELGLTPVLIYPENELPDFGDYVKRADALELRMLALASPYVGDAIRNLANNTVSVTTGQISTLQGDLTVGLPVAFGTPELAPQTEWIPIAHEPMAPVQPAPAPPPSALPSPVAHVLVESPVERSVELPVEPSVVESPLEPPLEPPVDAEEEYEAAPGIFPEPQLAQFDALPQPFPVFLQGEPETSFSPSDLNTLPPWGQDSPPLPMVEAELNDASAPVNEGTDEDFTFEMTSALSFTTPVVDLSAPGMETAPSFLTAEQLSDLLNTAESSPPPKPDPLDYPDADEGAIPDAMGDHSNFPPLSVENEALPEPVLAQPEAPPALPSAASTAALPSFPVPEEFEKDEFDFDVNLDQKVDQLPVDAMPLVPSPRETGVLATPVSNSLKQFEAVEPSVTSPTLDFDAPLLAKKLAEHQAVPVEPSEATAPQESSLPVVHEAPPPQPAGPETAAASEKVDAGMREALDSIYPPSPQPLAQAAGLDNGAGWQEESLSVVQKPPEPPSGEGSQTFKAGDKVQHPSYGLGIVQKVIPVDQSVILNITFENVGKRLLDPALTAISRL